MYRTQKLLAILPFLVLARGAAKADYLECGDYYGDFGYIGIFEGGNADQAITGSSREAGMPWREFTWFWSQKAAEGLHLTDIDSYPGDYIRHDGERLYTGVFRERNGHVLSVAQTWSSFYSIRKSYEADGLRLVDVEVYKVDGKLRFDGVFHPITDEVQLEINLDWDSFVALWERKAAEGMRLVDIETYWDGSRRLFLGVFRAGYGGRGLWMSTWDDFVKTWYDWTETGLDLIDVETFRQGNQIVYVGVYGPRVNGSAFIVGWDWEDFQRLQKGYEDIGYVLTDLEVQRCAPPAPTMMERRKWKAKAAPLEVVGGPQTVHSAGMSSIAAVAANGDAAEFLRGDANGDGVIRMDDAMAVLDYLFRGVGKIDCKDAADANDDGSVDMSDGLAILFHLYGGGNAPAGIAEVQTDDTPDALGCASAQERGSSARLEPIAPQPQVLVARPVNDPGPVGPAQPLKPVGPAGPGPAKPARPAETAGPGLAKPLRPLGALEH